MSQNPKITNDFIGTNIQFWVDIVLHGLTLCLKPARITVITKRLPVANISNLRICIYKDYVYTPK